MNNELITERLVLEVLQKEDVNLIYALRSNAVVNTFIQRDLYKAKEEAILYINKTHALIEKNKAIVWVIKTRKNKESIGSICLWNFSEDKTVAEVGYDLLPEFQKNGYMFEALGSVLEYGFSALGFNTIEAFTHKENNGSIKLLTKSNFILQQERTDKGFPNNSIYAVKR